MAATSPELEWKIVNSKTLDLSGLVSHLVHIGRNYFSTDHPDSRLEFIEHHRNTGGDSGIANWILRVDYPDTPPPEELIERSEKILSYNFDELVEHMKEYYLDIRQPWIPPVKRHDIGSFEQFYHWNCIFHNGEEYELIHMAIIQTNDVELREMWARVMARAFALSKQ